MTIDMLLAATAIVILLLLWLCECIARCQADEHGAQLRRHLDDAISVQLDQYEELEQLRAALDAALRQTNAANLRAQRTINSLRALPELKLQCPLPTEQTGVLPFNLN